MGEHLADKLLKAADVLHWFGKHDVANALILFARLCRAIDLDEVDEVEGFVEGYEKEQADLDAASPMPGKPEGGG